MLRKRGDDETEKRSKTRTKSRRRVAEMDRWVQAE